MASLLLDSATHADSVGSSALCRTPRCDICASECECQLEPSAYEREQRGELLIGQAARSVVPTIDVREFALPPCLHGKAADPQVFERSPDIGVVGAREAHHEGDRIVAPEHGCEPENDLERKRDLAVLDQIDQRRILEVDVLADLLHATAD